MQKNKTGINQSDIVFVKRVSIGSINPNYPLTEEQLDAQMAMLNKCLQEYPKGKIIGKEVSVGIYQVGEHQLSMEKTTYHVGFNRIPKWIKEE